MVEILQPAQSGTSCPQTTRSILPIGEERRRFQRIFIDLIGSYMLADRREFPCQITDISPGGMALIAPVRGRARECIIAYADHIGRLEGVITRQLANGFAMTFASTSHKRDKLAAQLTWLANRHLLNLPEQRRDDRLSPRNPVARLTLPNGLNIACHLIEISQSSATIAANQKPKIGAIITIGTTPGRVVRHIDEGFAIEFMRLRHQGFLEENVTSSAEA